MLIEKIETTATFECQGVVVAADIPVLIHVTRETYAEAPAPSTRPQEDGPLEWRGTGTIPANERAAFLGMLGTMARVRLAEGRSGDIVLERVGNLDPETEDGPTVRVDFRGTGALA